MNNASCAIFNNSSLNTISAENNWWGHLTGPLDDSDDTATGGFYNPNGLGACVSNYVDYVPWRDYWADIDSDGDGLTDYEEIHVYGTDPNNVDSDGDGLSDYDEVITYGTDPNNADTDGDGLSDYEEVIIYNTDPNSIDTDLDGINDALEISLGSDPNDKQDKPFLNNISLTRDTVFNNDSGAYVVQGSLKVSPGITLTIQSGTIVKFDTGAALFIEGTINAQGAAGNEIIFTSLKDDNYGGDTNGDGSATLPSEGDWLNIHFASDGSGIIENSIIDYTSDNTWIEVPVDDVRSVSLNYNTLGKTEYGNITVLGGVLAHDATWPALNVPYRIMGNITVQGQDGADDITTLILDSGSYLVFDAGVRLDIGGDIGDPGALIAQGEFGNNITLTSSSLTNTGAWGGIKFNNTANDLVTVLNYTTISNGGLGGFGNIYINQSSIKIYNSIIQNGITHGIKIDNGSAEIQHSVIRSNVKNGVSLINGAVTINYCDIYANGNYGVKNGTTVTLNAENNWWGSTSGPTHSSNPDGSGDEVSDYVDFTPWQTSREPFPFLMMLLLAN